MEAEPLVYGAALATWSRMSPLPRLSPDRKASPSGKATPHDAWQGLQIACLEEIAYHMGYSD